jgi:hypothetical protein
MVLAVLWLLLTWKVVMLCSLLILTRMPTMWNGLLFVYKKLYRSSSRQLTHRYKESFEDHWHFCFLVYTLVNIFMLEARKAAVLVAYICAYCANVSYRVKIPNILIVYLFVCLFIFLTLSLSMFFYFENLLHKYLDWKGQCSLLCTYHTNGPYLHQ